MKAPTQDQAVCVMVAVALGLLADALRRRRTADE